MDNGMTLIWGCSHFSANACLAPICSLHHVAVTTVEGIGSTKTRLHPVQVTRAKGAHDKATDLLWVVGLSPLGKGGIMARPLPHLLRGGGWGLGCETEKGGGAMLRLSPVVGRT